MAAPDPRPPQPTTPALNGCPSTAVLRNAGSTTSGVDSPGVQDRISWLAPITPMAPNAVFSKNLRLLVGLVGFML
jgi:hypothetical protein